jgi:hypothetical protein
MVMALLAEFAWSWSRLMRGNPLRMSHFMSYYLLRAHHTANDSMRNLCTILFAIMFQLPTFFHSGGVGNYPLAPRHRWVSRLFGVVIPFLSFVYALKSELETVVSVLVSQNSWWTFNTGLLLKWSGFSSQVVSIWQHTDSQWRCRTRNDTRLGWTHAVAARGPEVIFLPGCSVSRVRWAPSLISACRQLRLVALTANAGSVVPGNVERVILGSRTCVFFVQACVQSARLYGQPVRIWATWA